MPSYAFSILTGITHATRLIRYNGLVHRTRPLPWQPSFLPYTSKRDYSDSSESKPRFAYQKLPSLDPATLHSNDYIDVQGRKSARFYRNKSTAVLRYAYEDGSKKKKPIPFPPLTRGFLYFHQAVHTPGAGELRLRITENKQPSSFEDGYDLYTPDGRTWSVPLSTLMDDPYMRAIRDKLFGKRPNPDLVPAVDSSAMDQAQDKKQKRDRYRRLPNLLPESLHFEDFVDFSAATSLTYNRYSSKAILRYSFEERTGDSIPFPPSTRGFLYYHSFDNLSPLANELRFRLTSSDNPKSFHDGVDLRLPNGLPWSVPMWIILTRSNLDAFANKLSTRTRWLRPMIGSDIVDRCRKIFPTEWPHPFDRNVIFSLGQPFAVPLQAKTVTLWVPDWERTWLERVNMRTDFLRPFLQGIEDVRLSEATEGSAHVCIEYETDSGTFFARVLKIQQRYGGVPLAVDNPPTEMITADQHDLHPLRVLIQAASQSPHSIR